MSADSWATCPRCAAKGEIGIRGQEFREDYELGLNDLNNWGEDEQDKAPCVILNYRGECQSCGLKVEIHERFPLTWEQPKNEPTGFIVRKAWQHIPAGWFVRAKPAGPWYEVLSTRAMHSDLQLVKLSWVESGVTLDVETRRPREDVVDCRRGSLAPSSVQAALEALGEGVQILEDGA